MHKRPQLEGIAVDDILYILAQLSEQDAVDAIAEVIAARFDGQGLAKIVASLTDLRDWERGSKAGAGGPRGASMADANVSRARGKDRESPGDRFTKFLENFEERAPKRKRP